MATPDGKKPKEEEEEEEEVCKATGATRQTYVIDWISHSRRSAH